MPARRLVAACVLAAVLTAGAGAWYAVPRGAAPSTKVVEGEASWREVPWPFPLDPWPAGRAFRCAGAACAPSMRLAVRPKLGFCNCTTGVADDDEIDRVSDLPVLGERYAPAGPGWPVVFGPFAGRARRYVFTDAGHRRRYALAVAASRRCDVVVALVDGEGPIGAAGEAAALRFLADAPLLAWATAAVGGT